MFLIRRIREGEYRRYNTNGIGWVSITMPWLSSSIRYQGSISISHQGEEQIRIREKDLRNTIYIALSDVHKLRRIYV